MAAGVAPGPSGWTADLLKILAEDPACLRPVTAMLVDIANNRLAGSVRNRLTLCNLIALPKDDKNIRPIAMGDALLKLAGRLVMAQHRDALVRHFAPLQLGAGIEGGGEMI